MKKKSVLFTFLLFAGLSLFAQVGINTDSSQPDGSSLLDVKSTTKGFLPPRMTSTEMYAIPSPAEGLMVYNTILKSMCYYDGSDWVITTNRDGSSCGDFLYGGQTYNSVIIGMQCWMRENLNIGIAIIVSQDQKDNGIIEKYCYDNNAANCDVYGGLYQWNEMMQYITTPGSQGICPPGWHLPTHAEWTTLTTALGGTTVAGGKLKEAGMFHWNSPNTGATNSSGFTGLGGGLSSSTATFIYLKEFGFFASSTETTPPGSVFGRDLYYSSSGVGLTTGIKTTGKSVRCLHD